MHTWNAINSWLALDGVKVILFGDEASCSFASEVRCVRRNLPCLSLSR